MQEYRYDFNYQLTDALFTPVAHNSGSVPSNTVQPAPYHDPSHGHYSYAYSVNDITYDLNGNIQTLKRNPYVALDAGVSPSDNLTYHYSSTLKNRLLYVSDAAGTSTGTETDFPNQSSGNYGYNEIGQLVSDTKDGLTYEYYSDGLTKNIKQGGVIRAAFEYNHLGLRQRKITYAGGEPTTYTWYVYDPGGALVSTYSTDIGNDTTIQEDMPLYAGGRIGMLNKGTGRYSFELTDHLGNVRSVIAKATSSNAVEVLSYSDYYPHGGLMPGRNYVSSPSHKYGLQQQEKDPETNFTNFELRQYDPRLGRWFNPDPFGQFYSPYLAMGNNPISFIDPTGGYSVGGGDFGFDDGATDYSGYSTNDPFFARDFEKQNHIDPMLMGEIRQRYDENYEYYRANTNLKGEWGHTETRTTTEVVHDSPTTYDMDPTHTVTKTTDVWISNPAMAVEGMNAAYFQNAKGKVLYESGAYNLHKLSGADGEKDGVPKGRNGWDFTFKVTGLKQGESLQIVQIINFSNDKNYNDKQAADRDYWRSPDGKTLGLVDSEEGLFYWNTTPDSKYPVSGNEIGARSRVNPDGTGRIRSFDGPTFVTDPTKAASSTTFHTYIVAVSASGTIRVIGMFETKYEGITRKTKLINIQDLGDFTPLDKTIIENKGIFKPR